WGEGSVHLGEFVGEEIGVVHRVNDHAVAYFKYQQPAVRHFGAIHRDVIETDPFSDGRECLVMSDCEVIEMGHEMLFFGATLGVLVHVGVDVMNHPVLRDSHMARVGMSFDQSYAVFPKETVTPAAIDKRLDKKFPFRSLIEIAFECRVKIQLGKTLASM